MLTLIELNYFTLFMIFIGCVARIIAAGVHSHKEALNRENYLNKVTEKNLGGKMEIEETPNKKPSPQSSFKKVHTESSEVSKPVQNQSQLTLNVISDEALTNSFLKAIKLERERKAKRFAYNLESIEERIIEKGSRNQRVHDESSQIINKNKICVQEKNNKIIQTDDEQAKSDSKYYLQHQKPENKGYSQKQTESKFFKNLEAKKLNLNKPFCEDYNHTIISKPSQNEDYSKKSSLEIKNVLLKREIGNAMLSNDEEDESFLPKYQTSLKKKESSRNSMNETPIRGHSSAKSFETTGDAQRNKRKLNFDEDPTLAAEKATSKSHPLSKNITIPTTQTLVPLNIDLKQDNNLSSTTDFSLKSPKKTNSDKITNEINSFPVNNFNLSFCNTPQRPNEQPEKKVLLSSMPDTLFPQENKSLTLNIEPKTPNFQGGSGLFSNLVPKSDLPNGKSLLSFQTDQTNLDATSQKTLFPNNNEKDKDLGSGSGLNVLNPPKMLSSLNSDHQGNAVNLLFSKTQSTSQDTLSLANQSSKGEKSLFGNIKGGEGSLPFSGLSSQGEGSKLLSNSGILSLTNKTGGEQKNENNLAVGMGGILNIPTFINKANPTTNTSISDSGLMGNSTNSSMNSGKPPSALGGIFGNLNEVAGKANNGGVLNNNFRQSSESISASIGTSKENNIFSFNTGNNSLFGTTSNNNPFGMISGKNFLGSSTSPITTTISETISKTGLDTTIEHNSEAGNKKVQYPIP